MLLALGAHPKDVPIWVLDDITDLYMCIAQGLAALPPAVEPIFLQTRDGQLIAMDWCKGFTQAVALRPNEWLRLTVSGTCGHLIAPILINLLDGHGNSVMGIVQEELDEALAEAADAIPAAVAAMFAYWR